MVDRRSTRPLHRQVADALRQAILGHDWPPGSALPSEAGLCERFGVGRSVVRQAVAGLAAEDLVVRSQGRPTVVAPPAEYRRLVQRATGLFDQFAHRGHELRTTVLDLAADQPPSRAQTFLATPECVRLERVRLVDGEPFSYVRTWLPTARVPGLSSDTLVDASLHRLLTSEYGLRPVSGRRQVRAVAADQRIADALRMPTGGPLLLLEGESTDQHDRPLEWFASWHRADRVVFDINVSESAETMHLNPASEFPASRPEASGAAPELASQDLARARELLAELRTLLG